MGIFFLKWLQLNILNETLLNENPFQKKAILHFYPLAPGVTIYVKTPQNSTLFGLKIRILEFEVWFDGEFGCDGIDCCFCLNTEH
jgi:hypothetical protein